MNKIIWKIWHTTRIQHPLLDPFGEKLEVLLLNLQFLTKLAAQAQSHFMFLLLGICPEYVTRWIQ